MNSIKNNVAGANHPNIKDAEATSHGRQDVDNYAQVLNQSLATGDATPPLGAADGHLVDGRRTLKARKQKLAALR